MNRIKVNMSNLTNVMLACDDDKKTGSHKVMEHASSTLNIKYLHKMAYESTCLGL